ncbi:RiPP maturation radical SAM C-methyltransferase [Sphingomonas oryzagri]
MTEKRILFVVMPWHSLHLPSLAVGILTEHVRRRAGVRPISSQALYANLLWTEHLLGETHGRVTPAHYQLLGEDYFFQATGEWVFSSALHDVPEWEVERYREAFEGPPESFELGLAAHRASPSFIDALARQVVESKPDIVGLTSVFQQNIPCLALAKRLKSLAPDITIIMGGSNCDGVQGPALHRCYPFLDVVFSGESDYSFPAFLRSLDCEISLADIAGISWHNDGELVINKPSALPKAEDFVTPNHDDYFEQAIASPMSRHLEPNIVTESARGCWWGQKHHCTFCGLNGMGMSFRSKQPDVFLQEMEHLISRYQTLDVVLADNILDMKYFSSLLPAIASRGWDVRLHYEIKANLKRAQLEQLRDAGVWHIQPGIESLSTNVLRIMDKGTSGPQNIRLLRECEELSLTTTWNILAGFPGEDEEDYRAILKQMSALVHLQPPSGAARLALERFSPFFNNPGLGFTEQIPAYTYGLAYGLPVEDLRDIVYIFDDAGHGISDNLIAEMQAAVLDWERAYQADSTLTLTRSAAQTCILDQRYGWERRQIVWDDPIRIALYDLIGDPRSLEQIPHLLAGKGLEVHPERVAEIVAELRRDGLIFEDEGQIVAVATNIVPFRLRLAA